MMIIRIFRQSLKYEMELHGIALFLLDDSLWLKLCLNQAFVNIYFSESLEELDLYCLCLFSLFFSKIVVFPYAI